MVRDPQGIVAREKENVLGWIDYYATSTSDSDKDGRPTKHRQEWKA